MDRQTTFLLALGLLVAAALVVSMSGWVLFLRDRTLAKELGGAHGGGPSMDAHHDDHPEVAEES